MGFLEAMYKEVILEHYRSPRNRGTLEAPSLVQAGLNPSCGDQLELQFLLDGERILDLRFSGHGCAISQASASLMTEAVKGRTIGEGLALSRQFQAMLRGAEPDPSLGELAALQGIARLHARVRCASLAWTTLEAAGADFRARAGSGG